MGPIRSEFIGHTATFYSICGKTVAENITDVELDSCEELIKITADKIIYAIYGTRTIFESNQRLFHVSNKYEVTK